MRLFLRVYKLGLKFFLDKMRIFNLVGVSFAAHLPNCNLTDHSAEVFDEYSCDGCHGTKYDERCWSNNDPHGGLGRDFTDRTTD